MKVNYEAVFEHIGYLAYSIALPSGALSESRIAKLKSIFGLVWKENDSLSIHLNDCAKAGIDYCMDNFLTSEHAFSSFEDYSRIHMTPFGNTLREEIVSFVRLVFGEFPSPEGATRVERVAQMMSNLGAAHVH